jgi:hypothetical protein
MSSVLGTAEHVMAAAGSLLKDKRDEFDELRSLLQQVDLGPVSEWDCEIVTLLCPLETWTSTFTVCGVLLPSS